MPVPETQKAEWASQFRSVLMAAMAVVLLGHAWSVDDTTGMDPVLHHGGWALSILAYLLLIALPAWRGKGSLFEFTRRIVRIMDDEVSMANRSRALQAGFWTAMLLGLVLYFVSLEWELGLRHTLRILVNVSLAVALLRYAWLELR